MSRYLFLECIQYLIMINKILTNIFNKIFKENIEKTKILSGKNLINNNIKNGSKNLNDYEASIFSQWGEDGIINYLINEINPKEKVFLEFGVDNYDESNTRFLLFNDNWSGHIIDGDLQNIEYIKKNYYYWRYDLNAYNKFIDAENINAFLKSKINGQLGLISIDIDGNDYWILKEIDLKFFCPEILICEYNSLLGYKYGLTIPYDKSFIRGEKNSNIYYGASLKAINDLCEEKGYFLVGTNLNGNNIFFLRNDHKNKFKQITPEQAFKKAKFRENRDSNKTLTYNNFAENQKILSDYKFYNTDSKENVIFKNLKI